MLNIGNKRGETVLILPVMIVFVVMFLYLGVDIMGIYSTNQKLRLATSETLTLLKMDNEWTDQTQEYFDEMIEDTGLEGKINTLTHTSDKVQRGDPVFIEATVNYEVRAFRPMGHTFQYPIKVKVSGLAQKFIRE